jgi:hypothetical protein
MQILLLHHSKEQTMAVFFLHSKYLQLDLEHDRKVYYTVSKQGMSTALRGATDGPLDE